VEIFIRFAGSASAVVYYVDDPQTIIRQYKLCSEIGYPGERAITFTTTDGKYVCLSTEHVQTIEVMPG